MHEPYTTTQPHLAVDDATPDSRRRIHRLAAIGLEAYAPPAATSTGGARGTHRTRAAAVATLRHAGLVVRRTA